MWLSRYWIQIAIVCAFLGLLTSTNALVGLGVFIVLAGFVGTKWSDHVFDDLRYERRIPESRAFPGETIQITLRLTNDKFLPIPWIEVRDLIPEDCLIDEAHTGASVSQGYVTLVRSTHLGAYQRVNWPLEFRATHRGYFKLGPARFTSGDIFGFFPASKDDSERNSQGVIVYPEVYNLPDLGMPAERPFGELKGRERIFEDPSRVAGNRDYRPGDQMRRIDWKATARRQSMQSRVYEPSSTLHMLVAVNVHTLAHSWQGYVPEQLDRVLSVAASVARHGFEAGYAVGMVANGSYPTSDRPMRIPVGRRSDQLARVLEALAVIGPLTLTPLETVITREARSFPFGATLVCVTTRMDEPLAAALRRVSSAGHTVTVVSLQDVDFEDYLGNIRVYNVNAAVQAIEARLQHARTEARGVVAEVFRR